MDIATNPWSAAPRGQGQTIGIACDEFSGRLTFLQNLSDMRKRRFRQSCFMI
jgi:hypothetical protein